MTGQLGFYRPHEQHEGPASSCVIHGIQVGWLNCTACAMAMGIDQASLGSQRPDDCTIRTFTGDSSGGTTLPQVAKVAEDRYGIDVELHTGGNVASPNYLAGQLRRGRPIEVQGNAGALVHTPYRSTYGKVNHCVHWCEGKDWRVIGGVWLPNYVLAFDPAADTRHVAWGTAADAPDWWPWSVALGFMAALEPNGDGTARLGPGKAYAALLPLPRVRLRYTGSTRLSGPAYHTVVPPGAAGRRINVRSGPSTKYPVKATMGKGDTFVAFQRNPAGQKLDGSSLWLGSQDGSLWAHSSGLR